MMSFHLYKDYMDLGDRHKYHHHFLSLSLWTQKNEVQGPIQYLLLISKSAKFDKNLNSWLKVFLFLSVSEK